MAMPMPPPMHSVARPFLASRLAISYKSNLEAALRKLKGLDGAAAAAAADWLDDARARLAADRAVAALTVRAIAVLKNRG